MFTLVLPQPVQPPEPEFWELAIHERCAKGPWLLTKDREERDSAILKNRWQKGSCCLSNRAALRWRSVPVRRAASGFPAPSIYRDLNSINASPIPSIRMLYTLRCFVLAKYEMYVPLQEWKFPESLQELHEASHFQPWWWQLLQSQTERPCRWKHRGWEGRYELLLLLCLRDFSCHVSCLNHCSPQKVDEHFTKQLCQMSKEHRESDSSSSWNGTFSIVVSVWPKVV